MQAQNSRQSQGGGTHSVRGRTSVNRGGPRRYTGMSNPNTGHFQTFSRIQSDQQYREPNFGFRGCAPHTGLTSNDMNPVNQIPTSQQNPMDFVNQMMQGAGELEVTYKVKRAAQPDSPYHQNVPRTVQPPFTQQFTTVPPFPMTPLQPDMTVPPPPLMHLNGKRSQSVANVRNIGQENIRKQGVKQHHPLKADNRQKGSEINQMTRASSLQNIGNNKSRGGQRSNELRTQPRRQKGERSFLHENNEQAGAEARTQRVCFPRGECNDNPEEYGKQQRRHDRYSTSVTGGDCKRRESYGSESSDSETLEYITESRQTDTETKRRQNRRKNADTPDDVKTMDNSTDWQEMFNELCLFDTDETEQENNKNLSESLVTECSVDSGPDEMEVFKLLVKEMNGEGSLDDVKSKMFVDYHGNIDEWFRRHNRRFTIFRKGNKIIRVCVFVKDAEFCIDYNSKWKCTKDDCTRYHVCKALLCGLCTFGERCKLSHDCLDKVNAPISVQLGFNNVFDNYQIIKILSLRYPHICESWNNNRSCTNATCCKLHLCRKYLFGDCLEGEDCPLKHSLSTLTHNEMVVSAYRMTKMKPKIFNKLILANRRLTVNSIGIAQNISGEGENHKNILPVTEVAETSQGTHEITTTRPVLRNTSRTRHARPKRKAHENIGPGDTFLSSDSAAGPKYICQKNLTERCENGKCQNYHGDTDGLPYVWQVKLYRNWISLPVEQAEGVEACFCSWKENSETYILAAEDGLKQEYCVHFYPEIYAYSKKLDNDGKTVRIPARRLSTPSYAEGKWNGKSFKTQWRWSWVDDTGNIQLFDTDNLQYTLEKKYLGGQKNYMFSTKSDCLDLINMTLDNLLTKKQMKVIRRPLFVAKKDVLEKRYPPCLQRPASVSLALPKGWVDWDLAQKFELVELETGSESYKSVESRFYETLERNKQGIDKVYRVQNPDLWRAFINHKSTMSENAKRDGRDPDRLERMLFHGTDSLDTVRGISTNNFDHRLSGKNRTKYGEGAYFAETAKYSHAYTEGPHRSMFLARVLVGEYTKGEPDYKRPPSKPEKAYELYDSCVNDMTFPLIFVVFDTKQCYPEFLIQYHSFDDITDPCNTIQSHKEMSSQSNGDASQGLHFSPALRNAPDAISESASQPPLQYPDDSTKCQSTLRSRKPTPPPRPRKPSPPRDTNSSTNKGDDSYQSKSKPMSSNISNSYISAKARRRSPSPPAFVSPESEIRDRNSRDRLRLTTPSPDSGPSPSNTTTSRILTKTRPNSPSPPHFMNPNTDCGENTYQRSARPSSPSPDSLKGPSTGNISSFCSSTKTKPRSPSPPGFMIQNNDITNRTCNLGDSSKERPSAPSSSRESHPANKNRDVMLSRKSRHLSPPPPTMSTDRYQINARPRIPSPSRVMNASSNIHGLSYPQRERRRSPSPSHVKDTATEKKK